MGEDSQAATTRVAQATFPVSLAEMQLLLRLRALRKTPDRTRLEIELDRSEIVITNCIKVQREVFA